MEKEIIDFAKSQHTVYFPKKKMEDYKMQCVELTGKDPEDIKNMAQFIELVTETALGNVEHLALQITELSKKQAVDSEIIKSRDLRVLELEKINDENISSFEQRKEEIVDSLQNEIENLKSQNSKLIQSKLELIQKVSLKENEILIKLSDFHKEAFAKVLQNSEVQESFRKMNQNGRMNGVFDIIDTPDAKINIANLLTSVTVGSIAQKVICMNNGNPVISISSLNNAISKFIEK